MHATVSPPPTGTGNRKAPARTKSKLVAQVLRAAYRRHVRDRFTRLAVKQCLG